MRHRPEIHLAIAGDHQRIERAVQIRRDARQGVGLHAQRRFHCLLEVPVSVGGSVFQMRVDERVLDKGHDKLLVADAQNERAHLANQASQTLCCRDSRPPQRIGATLLTCTR